MTARRPVLIVTNHVPPDRVAAYAALHEREGIELALFGGRSKHATAGVDDPGVPHRRVAQRGVLALAASGRYRAVVAGTVGRAALPAAYAGARRAHVPFVFWTALWAHPRTPAHAASLPLLRRLYVAADAIVTYGPHVSAYVRRRGARNVHEAPQAVDNSFWSAPVAADRQHDTFKILFVGRDSREKGLTVLLAAWNDCRLQLRRAALLLVGAGPVAPGARTDGAASAGWNRGQTLRPPYEMQGLTPTPAAGVSRHGVLPPTEIRNFYARCHVLVMPSIPTGAFREPWGLVANEAMNQHTPVIATDAVGAAAGGLVRHERNGLVVPANDPAALGAALRRLHDDPDLQARLGRHAARDVHAYTFDAWAAGFSTALRSVGAGAGRKAVLA
jgi:glycosyltransferase involved in cell wall biosynthesis